MDERSAGPAREPGSLEATLAEVDRARGGDARLDAFADRLRDRFGDRDTLEWQARRLTGALALAPQTSLLVRHAPEAVADAFCAARLGDGGRMFGALPAGVDAGAILDRSRSVA